MRQAHAFFIPKSIDASNDGFSRNWVLTDEDRILGLTILPLLYSMFNPLQGFWKP